MFTWDRLKFPVVIAPMAGGPSTAQMAVEASAAGGLGFIAGGNKDVASMAEQVNDCVSEDSLIAVNLFVPGQRYKDRSALEEAGEKIKPIFRQFGLSDPSVEGWDDDDYELKVAWLVENPADIVTFTFGVPDGSVISALHSVDTCLGVMVTCAEEAKVASTAGVDFLIVQGPEAGGHRGTFNASMEPSEQCLPSLLDSIREIVNVPLVAAGGIATPEDVAGVLEHGAVAAQVGTAFLCSRSAGSSMTHRLALTSPEFTETVVTRSFSGRYARSLKNQFSLYMENTSVPPAYPEINRMFGPLRKASADSGDPNWTHLWAGTGWRRTQAAMPADLLQGDAGQILGWLASQWHGQEGRSYTRSL